MAMFNSYVRLPEGNGQELGVDLGWPLSLNWVSNCALWGMLGDFPPNFRTSWWRAKTSLKIFFCLEGWWKSVDVVVFTMVNPMIPSSYSTATLHGPTAWRHVFLGLIGEWDWEIPPMKNMITSWEATHPKASKRGITSGSPNLSQQKRCEVSL